MNTEEALRATLQERADISTTGDPWQRIDRAHRRSQLRRRAALAGALAVLVAGGAAVTTTPWETNQTQPAGGDKNDKNDLKSNWLDDGRPRGALGEDPEIRKAAIATVRREAEEEGGHLKRDDDVHVLYAEEHADTILALARAYTQDQKGHPADNYYWFTGTPSLKVQAIQPSVMGAPTITYPGPGGEQHVLGIVPRTGSVSAGHVTIGTDGKVHRTWATADVEDGVVDLPVGDVRSTGPIVLRVKGGEETAYSEPEGAWTMGAGGFDPYATSAADENAAVRGAPGGGVDGITAESAINSLLLETGISADLAHPKALWAGDVPGAGQVVIVAAGLPGQGRVLRASAFKSGHEQWAYTTAIPAAGPLGALGWRVVSDNGKNDVVGWFFDQNPGGGTTVNVDGQETASSSMNVLTVKPDQDVKVTHGRTQLDLGPEARDAGQSPYAPGN